VSTFSIAAKRRREIVKHAKYVGAADSDDLSRWLIAWVWHNPTAKDQIWSLMQCAQNIGRKITEEEASEITEEASITRKHLSADNLAKFLGVTWAVRQELGLTTIGSTNVGKRARKALRKHRARLKRAERRRASGMPARHEYRANSITAQAAAEGVSRMTIYRRRKQAKNTPNVTSVSTPIFLSTEVRLVTSRERKGLSEGYLTLVKKEEVNRLADCSPLAADGTQHCHWN
jgi:hypothetical protein